MKQVEVTILGQGYILGCPEGGEARLGAAVSAVDREMGAIRDAGKIKARDRIAVLAALNLAYQLAERPEVPAAFASDATSSEGPQSAAPRGGATTEPDVDLSSLIARLDAALADGQLL